MILNTVVKGENGGGLPAFSYSGLYIMKADSGENWRIGFITSGTLIPEEDLEVDIFLCGAGAGGQTGNRTSTANTYGNGGCDGGKSNTNTSYSTRAGHGGGGGYTNTVKKIKLLKGAEYPVVIGAGGSANSAGGQSSFDNYVALGGDGAVATNNTSVRGGSNGSPGQGTTTREFGEENGELYSGAGGAGGSYSNGLKAGGAGGAGGSSDASAGGGAFPSSNTTGGKGAASEAWLVGGANGGGAGGSAPGGGGGGGIGAGGGGGANSGGVGGKGAQGIVIIRNART